MHPFGASFIDLGDSTMGTPLEFKPKNATWTPLDELLSGIRNAARLRPHLGRDHLRSSTDYAASSWTSTLA